jgi:hypothetical protein
MLKSWRAWQNVTGKIGAQPYTLHPLALLWSHRAGVVRDGFASSLKKLMLYQCRRREHFA